MKPRARLARSPRGTIFNGIPDLVKVVREGNFLGVVATTEWGAIQATRKLKATWSKWDGLPEQAHLWDCVRSTKVNSDAVTSSVGDTTKALAEAPKRIAATYDFAIHTPLLHRIHTGWAGGK